ncbi:ABC transporter ATP-binding protein [Microbacterium sp. A93]|uniref:ABC transporter ATP-binding protein n=1 Tax=Microbacterium sp. A93 TaxID=3450716 RepID=UPI003F41D719
MNDQLAVELSGVSKRYRNQKDYAVRDVTLQIQPGEFVSFLGPSGSGKTTTLNLIAGFQDLTDGVVRVDGRDISRVAPHRRNLGIVFQDYALFPHMTVAKNLEFPLRQRRIARAERARLVSDALDAVDLTPLADRHPAQLSGGQRQRVALARSFIFDPAVLLMDEPLGALDKSLRGRMQEEIARLHKVIRKTVIFVTHDQEEALALSDRIAVFDGGSLQQVGTPEALFSRPETLFVAQFLGESSVLSGRYLGGGMAEIGGAKMPVILTGNIAVDQSVSVMVRPHQVSASIDAGGLDAVAIRHRYSGAQVVVTADTPGGEVRFVIDVAAPVPLAGTRLCLTWSEGSAIAYADENN